MSFLRQSDLYPLNIIFGLGKTFTRSWIPRRSSSRRVGKMRTLLFRGRIRQSLRRLLLPLVEVTHEAINVAVPNVVVLNEVDVVVAHKEGVINSVVAADHLEQATLLAIWAVEAVPAAFHLLRRTRIFGFILSNISRSRAFFQPVSLCSRRNDARRTRMPSAIKISALLPRRVIFT
jgi:hypothetical protein